MFGLSVLETIKFMNNNQILKLLCLNPTSHMALGRYFKGLSNDILAVLLLHLASVHFFIHLFFNY